MAGQAACVIFACVASTILISDYGLKRPELGFLLRITMKKARGRQGRPSSGTKMRCPELGPGPSHGTRVWPGAPYLCVLVPLPLLCPSFATLSHLWLCWRADDCSNPPSSDLPVQWPVTPRDSSSIGPWFMDTVSRTLSSTFWGWKNESEATELCKSNHFKYSGKVTTQRRAGGVYTVKTGVLRQLNTAGWYSSILAPYCFLKVG